MFQASRPEQSDDASKRAAGNIRRFGHIRQQLAANGSAEIMPDLTATEEIADGKEGVLPIDSAKTFVGPNGTYYDERWRHMEWRGLNRSWNWAAALTFGGWFAYRRMYEVAAAYLGWVVLSVILALFGVALRDLAFFHLIVALAAGFYGNTLYRQRFRRQALRSSLAADAHDERLAVLARSGGVDRLAVWIWAGVGLVALVLVFSSMDGVDLRL